MKLVTCCSIYDDIDLDPRSNHVKDQDPDYTHEKDPNTNGQNNRDHGAFGKGIIYTMIEIAIRQKSSIFRRQKFYSFFFNIWQ